MEKQNLNSLYEVFINQLYDSCKDYNQTMFDDVINTYIREVVNFNSIDETKKKLFIFHSYLETKKIINYRYYKTIMLKFLDELIDNEMYRECQKNFDENDIYLCYGLIAFTLLSFDFEKINIETFNLDKNFSKFKEFLENNSIDIKSKKSIYEQKFQKFKRSYKVQILYKDWLNVLYSKKLNSIKISKKKK